MHKCKLPLGGLSLTSYYRIRYIVYSGNFLVPNSGKVPDFIIIHLHNYVSVNFIGLLVSSRWGLHTILGVGLCCIM